MPTSIAAKIVASRCWSVARCQTETKGRRTHAGIGGKGMMPKPVDAPDASVIGITSWY
jgi:hypothetical protein